MKIFPIFTNKMLNQSICAYTSKKLCTYVNVLLYMHSVLNFVCTKINILCKKRKPKSDLQRYFEL